MNDFTSINEVITDYSIFSQSHIMRDGYEFKPLTQANVYDAIVIRDPPVTQSNRYWLPVTERALSECIALIQEMKLEKAIIYADDLSFIPKCPTLKYLSIIPTCNRNGFDYSPLYDMPQIRSLVCQTVYGEREQYSSSIDYAKIKGLELLGISGEGHKNYNGIQTLKALSISGYAHSDLYSLFCSQELDSLSMLCCKMKTLDGIERAPKMKCLYLDYNRSLKDISALRGVKRTLRALRIENCAKIEGFSALCELENLEFLELTGSNELENLNFLKSLKNLKTFVFSVNVKDGDLTPCMKLSYARCLRNRKHYNLKDAELPKGQYVHGNESLESWRRIE